MIAWQSGVLYSFDLIDFPATGKAASSGRKSSQGNAFTFSNNSSNVYASNSPTTIFTRSAVRNHKLAVAIVSIVPSKRARPFSTWHSIPRSLNSLPTSASSPLAAVATRLNFLFFSIHNLLIYKKRRWDISPTPHFYSNSE